MLRARQDGGPGGLVPGELDADGQERWVECTYCRTLNGPGAEHCYACGRVLPADDEWGPPEPTDRPQVRSVQLLARNA